MVNVIQEWIEEQAALYLPKSEHWLLKECFCSRGDNVAEWMVTKDQFMDVVVS